MAVEWRLNALVTNWEADTKKNPSNYIFNKLIKTIKYIVLIEKKKSCLYNFLMSLHKSVSLTDKLTF